MGISVIVGTVVVGSFTTKLGMTRCINSLAPGCKPSIKKGYHPQRVATQKRNSNEARQQTNRLGSYEKILFLKPGEFKL